MSDDKRGPSMPDDDPDRTEIHREDPFGDLSMGAEKTLDAERTSAADETVAQDADLEGTLLRLRRPVNIADEMVHEGRFEPGQSLGDLFLGKEP